MFQCLANLFLTVFLGGCAFSNPKITLPEAHDSTFFENENASQIFETWERFDLQKQKISAYEISDFIILQKLNLLDGILSNLNRQEGSLGIKHYIIDDPRVSVFSIGKGEVLFTKSFVQAAPDERFILAAVMHERGHFILKHFAHPNHIQTWLKEEIAADQLAVEKLEAFNLSYDFYLKFLSFLKNFPPTDKNLKTLYLNGLDTRRQFLVAWKKDLAKNTELKEKLSLNKKAILLKWLASFRQMFCDSKKNRCFQHAQSEVPGSSF